jgi:predicted TIM-barrel fold metal-dependent hydrolase
VHAHDAKRRVSFDKTARIATATPPKNASAGRHAGGRGKSDAGRSMATPGWNGEILEPDIPIVDPHHHVWYLPDALLTGLDALPGKDGGDIARMYRLHRRYLLDELLADLNAGHNVVATVFADAHTMYRAKGPDSHKSLGKIEFVTGFSAIADSGIFGPTRFCAGIIGSVDLLLGDEVAAILPLHLAAAGGRYRGVHPPALLADETLESLKGVLGPPHILLDPRFLAGARHLAPLGLSLDLLVLASQLPEVLHVARALPDLTIVINHTGAPVGIGPYAQDRAAHFARWRQDMTDLAACPNVRVKVGGLGMPFCGFPTSALPERAGYRELACDWTPLVETAIEIFGPDRSMFESNFPIVGVTARYPEIWNAFKMIVAGYSREEKLAPFGGTAARAYRVDPAG